MNACDQWMACLWKMTWQSAVLAGAVLIINLIFRRRLSAPWRCGLWLFVAIRLMLPALLSSRFSVFNLLDRSGDPTVAAALPQATDHTTVSVYYGPLARNLVASAPIRPTESHWTAILASVWIAGVFLLVLRQIVLEWRSAAMTWRMPSVTEPGVLEVVERCRHELKLWRRVQVSSSADIRTPAVCGFWRPTLILPADLAMNNSELRLIILHELTHIRRFDLQMDRMLGVLRDLHWFNPIAWLMLRCWRSERELACDEQVLRLVNAESRLQYGHVIVELVERFSGLRPAPGAVGLFESQSNLRRRISTIANFEVGRKLHWLGLILSSILVCTALTDARVAASRVVPATEQGRSVSPTMIIVVYEITDLTQSGIAQHLDHVINRKNGELAFPTRNPADVKQAQINETQSVIDAVRKSVPSDSWRDGGGNGTISIIPGQNQLVISQTPDNQRRIVATISHLRQDAETQVAFATYFVTLSPERAEKLHIHDGVRFDSAQLKVLLRNLRNDLNVTIASAPRISEFNGQQACVAVESQHSYISGYGPDPNGNRKPKSSIVATGLTFVLSPKVDSDHQSVVLNLHAKVTDLVKFEVQHTADDARLPFQEPILDTHERKAEITIPNSSALALRVNDAGLEKPGQSMWLIVEPTILEPAFKKLPNGGESITPHPDSRR